MTHSVPEAVFLSSRVIVMSSCSDTLKSRLEARGYAVATTPLKLPTQYSARGYQPTTYTVGYDAVAKEHRIAISGLVSR